MENAPAEKKTSAWVQHCRAYMDKHKVNYKTAMKDARASYYSAKGKKAEKAKEPKKVAKKTTKVKAKKEKVIKEVVKPKRKRGRPKKDNK